MQFLPSGQYCMTRIGTLPNRLSLYPYTHIPIASLGQSHYVLNALRISV